jgi:two-component system, chemotaxis family, CheB/CheR fusion protein
MKTLSRTKKQILNSADKRRRGSSTKAEVKKATDPIQPQSKKANDKRVDVSFPIVGIGASAGGLEAFEQFFRAMPPESGMAFVLIQHLDPTHKSILSDLIGHYTSMKVAQIQDAMRVEPNRVYVIPPNRYLAILHGKLHLMEPPVSSGIRTPIDSFFRSLAEDQKEKGICIVLSGTGTEGTLGLRAIKGEGGMVMVQSPESAKYNGMPRSAVATGLADYIVPVDKMPEHLVAYIQHVFAGVPQRRPKPILKEDGLLDKIFILVRSQTGHDFSYYKRNTIIRRIERRMAVNRIANFSEYVRYLQSYPEESQALFKDLLIGVTNFFRDPDAFVALKDKVISQLLENKRRDEAVRIWVPGCATGEEAYSLAILFQDHLAGFKKDFDVQIFATDIDDRAIETARSGLYPGSIAADVRPEILGRYFTKEDDGSYRVTKKIRDMVVFAVQNVIADPPFSKTDLISCRNLLIYLGPEPQKKVFSLFYYSLKNNGFLFLGTSETVGEASNLFSAVDRKWKLYKRKDTGSGITMDHIPFLPRDSVHQPDMESLKTISKLTYREAAEKILLDTYSPAGVIINEKSEILYVHGRTGKYLEHLSGEFSRNIMEIAREGLKYELASAIRKSVTDKKEVRRENIRVKTNGEDQFINLIIKPILEPLAMKGSIMVVFEDVPPERIDVLAAKTSDSTHDETNQQLEQELRSAKEYLQTTIEELETSNEELKSTNEELQSSNEELQSTNEELETSKEELQSLNEELVTVNSELEQKVNELSKVGSDMQNLLTSTDIGTIFLDTHLNIQRFTPVMTNFINLIQTDIGRPVSHIVSNMYYDGLVQDAKEVLKTLVPKEMEVKTKDERWYTMRMLPYRTVENVIDGVVITFLDITGLKVIGRKLEDALQFAQSIVDTTREGLVILDENLRVVSANRSFYRIFVLKSEDTLGNFLYELGDRQWDIPKLRQLLEKILPEKAKMDNFKLENEFEGIGKRKLILNARRLESEIDSTRILLAIEDITERKRP